MDNEIIQEMLETGSSAAKWIRSVLGSFLFHGRGSV
jgi:hypothetical protein